MYYTRGCGRWPLRLTHDERKRGRCRRAPRRAGRVQHGRRRGRAPRSSTTRRCAAPCRQLSLANHHDASQVGRPQQARPDGVGADVPEVGGPCQSREVETRSASKSATMIGPAPAFSLARAEILSEDCRGRGARDVRVLKTDDRCRKRSPRWRDFRLRETGARPRSWRLAHARRRGKNEVVFEAGAVSVRCRASRVAGLRRVIKTRSRRFETAREEPRAAPATSRGQSRWG